MPRTVWYVVSTREAFSAAETIRTATAAACVRNPMRLKRSSPREASATPDEIMNTMTARRLLGSWMRKVHEMSRMATGVNAYEQGQTNEIREAEGR